MSKDIKDIQAPGYAETLIWFIEELEKLLEKTLNPKEEENDK